MTNEIKITKRGRKSKKYEEKVKGFPVYMKPGEYDKVMENYTSLTEAVKTKIINNLK